MKIFNLLKVAYRSLNRNKLRSFLTMLGIIIGVASVIAMLAIGEGSNQNIKASIASLGTNSIMIFPGSNSAGGVHQGSAAGRWGGARWYGATAGATASRRQGKER